MCFKKWKVKSLFKCFSKSRHVSEVGLMQYKQVTSQVTGQLAFHKALLSLMHIVKLLYTRLIEIKD